MLSEYNKIHILIMQHWDYLFQFVTDSCIVFVFHSGSGRAYVSWFSERVSAVVVYDLGGSASGEGSGKAVDVVVDEIKAKGWKC